MISSLTTTRHAMAATIVDAVDEGVAVWPSPPTAPTAPGVYLLPVAATRTTACLVDSDTTVRCIGPGGDNEAGLAALELLVTQTALALMDAYPSARITLSAPTLETVAGAPTLVRDLTVMLTIRLEATDG